METEDWTYLKHEGTNAIWKAPTGVVEDMAEKGWYPTDERPVEFNPTLAERPAEWFEPIPGPEPVKKSSKPKSAASADTEGSDSVG